MALLDEAIRSGILEVVRELTGGGPGMLQSDAVIAESARRLGIQRDGEDELALLDIWQELFVEGVLAWGHDLHNTRPPFMHVTRKGRESLGL